MSSGNDGRLKLQRVPPGALRRAACTLCFIVVSLLMLQHLHTSVSRFSPGAVVVLVLTLGASLVPTFSSEDSKTLAARSLAIFGVGLFLGFCFYGGSPGVPHFLVDGGVLVLLVLQWRLLELRPGGR